MVIGAVGWLLQQGQSTADDGFGLTDATAIASIVIAGLALAISIRNRSTAKRALDLSERQEARRLIPFEVYLAEALRWARSDGTVLHGTSVRLSNPADRPATIVTAELLITYANSDDVLLTVKVPPAVVPPDLPIAGLQLPAQIDANSARSGWLLFEVRANLTAGSAVDRYDLVLDDVHGRSETLQVVSFREATPP